MIWVILFFALFFAIALIGLVEVIDWWQARRRWDKVLSEADVQKNSRPHSSTVTPIRPTDGEEGRMGVTRP